MKKKLDSSLPKQRFGSMSTKVGILTAALVAAPAFGAIAASTSFVYEDSPCVVASLKADPKIFSVHGYCDNSVVPNAAVGPSPDVTPSPTDSASTSPSATPSAIPSPSSSPTTPPAEPAPASGTIGEPALYSTSATRILLLNNGGFIETVNQKTAWITLTKGAVKKQITGLPARWTSFNDNITVNASPDAQTLVVYSANLVVVSFDGGATWTPQKDVYPGGGYMFISSSVSADGKTVAMSQGSNTTSSGVVTWLKADSPRQTTDWKQMTITPEYSIALSADGKQLTTTQVAPGAIYQTFIDLTVSPITRKTNNRYGYTWLSGYASSSDQQTQIIGMRDQATDVNHLYMSYDGGKTITEKMAGTFTSISISTDGVVQAAIDTHLPANIDRKLFMSFDSGHTWKQMDVLGGVKLNGISVAPDGKTMQIVTMDGKYYLADLNR